MTDEEKLAGLKAIKEMIVNKKAVYKQLAEECRKRCKTTFTPIEYHQFYHFLMAYNEMEDLLAEIENRAPVLLVSSKPPLITNITLSMQVRAKDWQLLNGQLLTVHLNKGD